MDSIEMTALVFIITLICHALVHRILLHRGIITLKTTGLYIAGFMTLVAIHTSGRFKEELFFTSMTLYIFSSLLVFFWYSSIFLVHETPAAMILYSFEKKKRQSLKDLVNLFSRQGLLEDRLCDLESSELVRVQHRLLHPTAAGSFVARAGIIYRKLFYGGYQ
jgi:hypothetical protein